MCVCIKYKYMHVTKLYDPSLTIGFNYLIAAKPLSSDSLLLTKRTCVIYA